jgi:hypothetical protein
VHASTLLHGVSQLRHGRRYSLIIFLGSRATVVPPELQFTPASRLAEAEMLAFLCNDATLCAVCRTVLPRNADASSRGSMLDPALLRPEAAATLGRLIESVVQRYGAPHLRPTAIELRSRNDAKGGWCWSLRALQSYMTLDAPSDVAP